MAKTQTKAERDALFANAPIPKALAAMAIPAIVSQLINLLYNMADTFFVGRVGNPYMIAAVSLAFTLYMFNLPMSGLFGIGGGSYIARMIGIKEYDRVRHSSAYSFYGALLVVLCYSLLVAVFLDPILKFLGASPDTIGFAKQYIWVVVIIGNIPTVLSATLSHLLRNAGYSKQASFGLSAGGVLNILLDPLFMFVILPDGLQILGAALATTISNSAALVYFIVIFNRTKAETGLSLKITDIRGIDREDKKAIFTIGIPSALTTLLMDFSNMFLNSSMAGHGDLELAALGIDLKIERLANAINLGIAQGMLPLVAFNYSRKNYTRMKDFLNFARKVGFIVCITSILLYQCFAKGLVNVFISSKGNPEEVATTIAFGIIFLRVRCLAAPFSMLNFVSTNGFQAMGDGKLSLLQVFFRQVVFYFPLLYGLNHFFGAVGLVAAYPVAELLSGAVSTILLQTKLNKVGSAQT